MLATLDDFHRYKEAAPVRLVAQGFGELVEDKGIGLVEAKFDGSLLTRVQALTLMRTIIDVYTTSAYSWVHTFNHDTSAFNFESFIEFFKNRLSVPRASI